VIARRSLPSSVAGERGDAISKAAVSRRKQNVARQTGRRRRFIAANIWRARDLKAKHASRIAGQTRPVLSFPFCGPRAERGASADVLVWPAKISRIFLLEINPGRNTGQRMRAENSLDKQPHHPLPDRFRPS
jgi:hypothetical protein